MEWEGNRMTAHPRRPTALLLPKAPHPDAHAVVPLSTEGALAADARGDANIHLGDGRGIYGEGDEYTTHQTPPRRKKRDLKGTAIIRPLTPAALRRKSGICVSKYMRDPKGARGIPREPVRTGANLIDGGAAGAPTGNARCSSTTGEPVPTPARTAGAHPHAARRVPRHCRVSTMAPRRARVIAPKVGAASRRILAQAGNTRTSQSGDDARKGQEIKKGGGGRKWKGHGGRTDADE
ncbi:hypothetical protein C8J57DRAFT_1225772 [Mycena rebaudengoi]|nr:hypothetical protein C8J57DRAFT_1225772 [Mycena rebaudengoi]